MVELDKFGLENESALNGLFHHVSVTSKILVVAVLYLFSNLKYVKNKAYLIIYLGVILFGVYAIYLCYTRTGWVLLIFLGSFFYCFIKLPFRNLLNIFLFLILGMLVVAFLFRNNETILLRLKGGTTYRQNEEFDPNVLTSYRLDIYGFALLNLANDGMPRSGFWTRQTTSSKANG